MTLPVYIRLRLLLIFPVLNMQMLNYFLFLPHLDHRLLIFLHKFSALSDNILLLQRTKIILTLRSASKISINIFTK